MGGFTPSGGVSLWVKRRADGAVDVGNEHVKIKILRCMHFYYHCPNYIYDYTMKI